MNQKDVHVLRELAKSYMEICAGDIQEERRELWRNHNSLVKSSVPVICSWYSGSNLSGSLLADQCVCEDRFFRNYELHFRNMIYHEALGDDTVMNPWVGVGAVHVVPPVCKDGATWGIKYERKEIREAQAWVIVPSVSEMEDLSRLVATPHEIDGEATSREFERLSDAIGDIVTIDLDRSPIYKCYNASDLCEALGYLVGIENLMIYMHEKPELIHGLVRFMQDAVLRQYDQADEAGDWSLTSGSNMGMPYSRDLPDPEPNHLGVNRNQLWFFNCAQAFTLVSPEMFEQFMLSYQMPIMEKFGLISYACCEDVTHKIGALRKIPNLRRIGIPPICNVGKCAEQIETDYVFAWKPNPAMICAGFDEDNIRKTIRAGLDASRGCVVDLMLKDITTVQNRPERLKRWIEIVREETEGR